MRLHKLLMAALLFATALAAGADELGYSVVRRIGEVEIRRYGPYAVAEIVVPGPQERVREQSWPVLNDYLSGENELRRQVVSLPPFIQTRSAERKDYWGRDHPSEGSVTYDARFVLRTGADLSGLPAPTDPRVRLRQVAAAPMAVIRFPGGTSPREVETQITRLTTALDAARLRWVGEPLLCIYDRPLTPGFMRRNEVWVRLAGLGGS